MSDQIKSIKINGIGDAVKTAVYSCIKITCSESRWCLESGWFLEIGEAGDHTCFRCLMSRNSFDHSSMPLLTFLLTRWRTGPSARSATASSRGCVTRALGVSRGHWLCHEGVGCVTRAFGVSRGQWVCHEGIGCVTRASGVSRGRWVPLCRNSCDHADSDLIREI